MLLPLQPQAVQQFDWVPEVELVVQRPLYTCGPGWVCADLPTEQANDSVGAAYMGPAPDERPPDGQACQLVTACMQQLQPLSTCRLTRCVAVWCSVHKRMQSARTDLQLEGACIRQEGPRTKTLATSCRQMNAAEVALTQRRLPGRWALRGQRICGPLPSTEPPLHCRSEPPAGQPDMSMAWHVKQHT